MREDHEDVLLVAAMLRELSPLLRLADARRRPDGTWRARTGAGARLRLAVTGMGAEAACEQAGRLLERTRARALLGLGVAGALSERLGVGDVVVADAVRGEDGEAPPPDRGWIRALTSSPGVCRGIVWTAPRPLWSAASKAAIAAALEGRTAVVDLESLGWATAAGARAVPYGIVRVVSDGPGEDLPAELAAAWDEDRVRLRKLVAGMARRPRSVLELLELRRRLRDGARRLAELVWRGLAKFPEAERGGA